jgi:hypothetical protein
MHVAPACVGSIEGSDHFGSYVRSLSLHFCKRLFPGLEPMTSWSQGKGIKEGEGEGERESILHHSLLTKRTLIWLSFSRKSISTYGVTIPYSWIISQSLFQLIHSSHMTGLSEWLISLSPISLENKNHKFCIPLYKAEIQNWKDKSITIGPTTSTTLCMKYGTFMLVLCKFFHLHNFCTGYSYSFTHAVCT